jgi:hypothetical protein
MFKVHRTFVSKILRNFFNLRPSLDIYSNNQVNVSISDAFIWRTDNKITTVFKFKDILNIFFNDYNSKVELVFFDQKNNFIMKKVLDKLSNLNEILIDKDYMNGLEDYGVFYIFHNTINKNNSIIRNSCYAGYSLRKNIPSFVHGNTVCAKKDFNKERYNFGIGGLTYLKNNIYQLQNFFFNEQIEIMLINPTKHRIKIQVNDYEFFLGSCCLKKIDFKNIKIVKIKSKCYLLRPIIFQYKDNEFLDVYHG